MGDITLNGDEVARVLEALTSAVELSADHDEDMAEETGYYDPKDIEDAQAFTDKLRDTLAMFTERMSQGG